MIHPINEGPLRAAAKIEPNPTVNDKQTSQQQAAEVRQIRPVENSEAGSKADAKTEQEKEQTKYVMDGNTVVFEKYNQKGDLIFRLPPDYKPVDERV